MNTLTTEETRKIVKEEYATADLEELAKKVGRTVCAVKNIAYQLGVKRPKMTQEHENLILEHYEEGDLDWLCEQTGRNRHAIGEFARRRGLKRKVNDNRKGTLEPLLNGSIISYYWLGFYLADGYIAKNGHFILSQSEKDKEQVYKLAKYLETSVYHIPKEKVGGFKNRTDSYRVNVCDKVLGVKIREMFKITDTKTSNGADLSFLTQDDDRNVALLIGFLDGDGSIKESEVCTVECHKSWLEPFVVLQSKLTKEFRDFQISIAFKKSANKNYLRVYIPKRTTRLLKRFAIEHDLPFSERKWDRVSD